MFVVSEAEAAAVLSMSRAASYPLRSMPRAASGYCTAEARECAAETAGGRTYRTNLDDK